MTTEKVNVLVSIVSFATSIGDECLQEIAAVSPRVNVTDIADLVKAEQSGDLAAREKLDTLLAEADVLFGVRPPKTFITRAPKLKWIQSTAAGVESLLDTDMLQSPIIITNYPHAVPVSEHALMFMLMLAKQAPACFQLKQDRQWKQFVPLLLNSKTVGIVGLGNVGQEVARLSKAFGMRVIALDVKEVTQAQNVDLMLSLEQLPQLLSESDFVVLTVPSTSETHRMLGEKEFRMMKTSAYLINVARGKVVDEEALIRALDENWIAGAGLDVFDIEPLPGDSKLWGFPNVVFSPHVAGNMENFNTPVTRLFCENLKLYLSGQKLRNVVDKKKGY